MVEVIRCSSDDFYCSYYKEDPGCKIISMGYMVSVVITNTPTDTHGFTKNPPHHVDPDNINPGMGYFLKKAHSENYGK